MTRLLDAYADVLPYGLQPTPFGEVWRALQIVASTVWDVDPAVYRAGIAWGWYVQRSPNALAAQRDLVIAALISEQAPLIKAGQTTEELVEYLRQWREYRPTYDRLEAIYKLFAADVEILPISTPGAPPVSDTRLAFYVRIYGVDFSRLLTLEEAHTIAIRATPLGSRPIVYYEFDEQLSVDTQPLKAGIASINYENDAICEPVELNNYTFIVADAATGQIVSGFSNELVYGEIEGIVSGFSNELVYGEIEGIVLQSPRLVYGIDISVPVQTFWFTENGRNERNNSLLPSFGYDIDLYNEDGTRASGVQYDGAYPLTYMKSDGNMFTYGDDRIIINSGVDLLGLESDEENNRSAWSVQVERVFTLSFANTQLPDITITLPADETGHKGTSITLPTMTGEYESGGKTWTPSAWDIGAFGSSYSLTADTIAHLVFEEVQQYQEITLYLASGANAVQTDITSAFTGNVNPAYCYQLYTDEQCTIPWTGYDYSNDYEIWYYYNGTWVRQVDAISAMPDYTTTGTPLRTIGLILMDTGYLWAVSNITGSSYSVTTSSITVRIYPKDQQYYVGYWNATSIYGNQSVGPTATRSLRGRPGSDGNVNIPWSSADPDLPQIAIYKFLLSGMNETQLSNMSLSLSSSIAIKNNNSISIECRCVLFTLSVPTQYCYSLNKANATVSYTSEAALYDENGNKMMYDDAASYKVIGLFKSNGSASTSSWNTISYLRISKKANGEAELKIMNNQSVTFSRVWYIKTPI